MKSRSPKLTEIPTIHQLTAKKTATGNGNSKPEIESNQYSMLAAALPVGCHTYSPAILLLPALPCLQTTAAFVHLTSSGRSARSSLYSWQADVSGFWCHRLERPASPRRIRAVTRGFQTTTRRPFCFPVPTKTLSYDSCVTITIHHYCLDTCGPCNN